MDYTKLTHLNGVWLRGADDARLTEEVCASVWPVAPDHDRSTTITTRRASAQLMPGLKERAKTLVELADSAAFLCRSAPLPMEPKAQERC